MVLNARLFLDVVTKSRNAIFFSPTVTKSRKVDLVTVGEKKKLGVYFFNIPDLVRNGAISSMNLGASFLCLFMAEEPLFASDTTPIAA